MRARELTGHKWVTNITVNNPDYKGRIEVMVYALNQAQARQLLKTQYGIQDHHIGSIRKAS